MEKADLLLLLDLRLLALFDEQNNTGDQFPVISACQRTRSLHFSLGTRDSDEKQNTKVERGKREADKNKQWKNGASAKSVRVWRFHCKHPKSDSVIPFSRLSHVSFSWMFDTKTEREQTQSPRQQLVGVLNSSAVCCRCELELKKLEETTVCA